MDRPSGPGATIVRPIGPAADAVSRWLGWHAYRLSVGVLLEGRDARDVIEQDLTGIRFSDPADPATLTHDASAPIGWEEVECRVDAAARTVTLRAADGTERTAVHHGRYGCIVLPECEHAPRVPYEPPPPRAGASTRPELPWPHGCALDRGALGADVDVAAIDAALARVVGDGKGRAAVVAHRGRLIAETYAPGFHRDSIHPSWSMTKSLAGALVGRAVHEGWLTLDEPAPIPAWRAAGDPRGAITVDDLLRMSSGLDCPRGVTPWAAGGFHLDPYLGEPDVNAACAARPPRHPPGTNCAYQNTDPLLAAQCAIDAAERHGIPRAEAPWTLLLDPLGIDSMQLSADTSGTFILCGTSVATAQDWARFGQLVLDDGVWHGKRLLPEGWLAYACTPAPADDEPVYGGALMWLADGPLADDRARIPAGGALAFGMLGQLTFVLPSHELVIVRMGHDWADEPILDAVAAIVAAVDPGRGD